MADPGINDPVMAILERPGVSAAGPEIIEELEAVLLSIFSPSCDALRWDEKSKTWDIAMNHKKITPLWFIKAAEIPFRDEVHADILHLLSFSLARYNSNLKCNVSVVTMIRLAEIGILHRLAWVRMPISAMLAYFELDDTDNWWPNGSWIVNEFLGVCFGASPEEERIKLIRYLGGRFTSSKCMNALDAFIDELHARAMSKYARGEKISATMIQTVIDVWASYYGVTDQDAIYRRESSYIMDLEDPGDMPNLAAFIRLSRWIDTSLLLLRDFDCAFPYRPEMIAEWPVMRDDEGQWRLKSGYSISLRWVRVWQREHIYRVLALMVLLGGVDASGELRVSDAPVARGFYRAQRQRTVDTIKRFFRIAARLPMELQEILAQIVVTEAIVVRLGAVPEYTWRWALKA